MKGGKGRAPAVELSGDALLQWRGEAQVEHVDVREGILWT